MTWTLIALGAVGCGASAQLVQHTPSGGTVALEGPYSERVAKSMVVMSQHCDGDFQVLDAEGTRVDAPTRDQSVATFECVGPSLASAD